MEKATELEWLRFFYRDCDFGPAHEDVIDIHKQRFIAITGKALPDGYGNDNE